MELARRFSGFLVFSRFLVGSGCLLQGSRRNGGIVVKQRHTHKSFAGIVEMTALNLHIAGEQTRLCIHLPFRLQRHDFLRDLFRIIRFM